MISPDTTLTPEAEQERQYRTDLLRATTNHIDPAILGEVTIRELIVLEEHLHAARDNGDRLSLEDIINRSVSAQPALRGILDHVVTGLDMTIRLVIESIASGNTDYLSGYIRSSDAPIPPSESIRFN